MALLSQVRVRVRVRGRAALRGLAWHRAVRAAAPQLALLEGLAPCAGALLLPLCWPVLHRVGPLPPTSSPPPCTQACARHEAAAQAQPGSLTALLSWGVALHDLAGAAKAVDPLAARCACVMRVYSCVRTCVRVEVRACVCLCVRACVCMLGANGCTAWVGVGMACVYGRACTHACARGMALSCRAPAACAARSACLVAATQRYADALRIQPDNPQVLNNWGLVLQVRVPPPTTAVHWGCRVLP